MLVHSKNAGFTLYLRSDGARKEMERRRLDFLIFYLFCSVLRLRVGRKTGDVLFPFFLPFFSEVRFSYDSDNSKSNCWSFYKLEKEKMDCFRYFQFFPWVLVFINLERQETKSSFMVHEFGDQ